MLRELEEMREAVKVERHSINKLVEQRTQQLHAVEQSAWQARLKEIEEKNALELAAERELARLPRQIFEDLTNKIAAGNQNSPAYRPARFHEAWRSANAVREEELTRLVAELNDAKMALDKFGEEEIQLSCRCQH